MIKINGKEAEIMGRPRKYKRVEDMDRGIEAYFEACKPEYMLDEDGRPCLDRKGEPVILSNRRPTMAGLALALGFDSREVLFRSRGKSKH